MMAPQGAVRAAVAPTASVTPLTMMARAPPSKKPVKRVVKKTVKKVAKKPVKRVAKKAPAGRTNRFASAGGVSAARGGSGKSELGKLAGNTIGAVKGYGGGNGEILFTPTTAAAIVAWLFILFRFVLFYGAFGGE